MSKPDWCTQEVWERAEMLVVSVNGDATESSIFNIARALLDAHQRGRREGMERAADHLGEMAKDTPLGHESVSRGRSTYNWLRYCEEAIRAKANEVKP